MIGIKYLLYCIVKYKFLLWREVWRNQRTWPGLRTAGADGKRLLHFTWAIIQGKGKNWFVIHLGNANDTAPNLSYRNFIHLHEHIISCMKCFNWFYKSWFTVIHGDFHCWNWRHWSLHWELQVPFLEDFVDRCKLKFW